MELIKTILMGLLQGITEFMPVSSMGHLTLLEQIFQSESGTQMFLICLLHMASLTAVLIVFAKDIANLSVAFCTILLDICANVVIFLKRLMGIKTEGYYIINSSPHRKFLISLMETSLVTALVGIGMRSVVGRMTNDLFLTGIGFIINGILLFICDKIPKGNKKIKNLNSFDAVIIGAAQGFAVMPGLSRMGLSIMAAMALGTEKSFAVKYSVISSIPVIFGSFLLELTALGGSSLRMDLAADYLIAMVVTLLVARVCIKIVLGIIKKYPMAGFSVYSGAIGVISIAVGLIK